MGPQTYRCRTGAYFLQHLEAVIASCAAQRLYTPEVSDLRVVRVEAVGVDTRAVHLGCILPEGLAAP